ncbi:MAG: hypothetical protein Q9M91_00640 [Candidatus Dojkabacteria bacterium]|nr:hypothetical protein [Candidatus Dojkabacteria bacterium]
MSKQHLTSWRKKKIPGLIEYLTDYNDRILVDHIGCRIPWGPNGIGDFSNYNQAIDILIADEFKIIAETIIPSIDGIGRPIIILEKESQTLMFELPAPRVSGNNPHKSDLEFKLDHIEVVLPRNSSLIDFIKIYGEDLVSRELCNLEDINTTLLKVKNNEVNVDLMIVFKNGNRIKFHERSIGEVISDEQSSDEFIREQSLLRQQYQDRYNSFRFKTELKIDSEA